MLIVCYQISQKDASVLLIRVTASEPLLPCDSLVINGTPTRIDFYSSFKERYRCTKGDGELEISLYVSQMLLIWPFSSGELQL